MSTQNYTQVTLTHTHIMPFVTDFIQDSRNINIMRIVIKYVMNGSTVRLCFVSGREKKRERESVLERERVEAMRRRLTTNNYDDENDNDNEMKDYDAAVEFLG